MRWFLVVLAACESASPPTPSPTPTPIVPVTPDAAPAPPPPPTGPQFVVEVGKTLRWYTVEHTTVRQFGSVDLPGKIFTLGWANRQPVMMFEDHRIATATPTSLDFITLPPVSTWAHPKPANATEPQSPPDIRLETKNDEIWVGRCEWLDSSGLGAICAEWVDARIRPSPIKIETAMGEYFRPVPDAAHLSPPLAAPTTIKATLVPDKERYKGKRDKLRCTDGAITTEDPPVGKPFQQAFDVFTEYGRTDLVWLSTDPPIFQLADHDDCRPCPRRVIFERCKPSQRYNSVEVGPDDILAFTGDDNNAPKKSYAWNVMMFRDGRELATIMHVTEFGFVR